MSTRRARKRPAAAGKPAAVPEAEADAPKVPVRFRLGNLAGITTELKRAYAAAWRGQIPFQALNPIVKALREMRHELEAKELSERTDRLERAVDAMMRDRTRGQTMPGSRSPWANNGKPPAGLRQ